MPDGTIEGSLGRPDVDGEATAAARDLLTAERSEIRTLADGVRAFVEILEPPLRLVICGAGHDAIPLVRAASLLGWNATVVDDRPAFLDLERFPEAHAFVPSKKSRNEKMKVTTPPTIITMSATVGCRFMPEPPFAADRDAL